MSCHSPNLQQIPRSKEHRACFQAAPGKKFIKADYNAIEVRVAAEFAGDEVLLARFQEGGDIHRWAASYITGKDIGAITDEERQLAKGVNFGLIYGMQPRSLSKFVTQGYGVPLDAAEASKVRYKYFQTFSGLAAWHRQQSVARTTRTVDGRLWTWPNGRPSPQQLYNTPVQGSAADGMKWALAELSRTWTPELEGCCPILAIHDELVVGIPEDKVEIAAQWVKNAMTVGMERVLKQVPVVVETTVCSSY
jgi:DNA polymerase I